MTPFVKGSWWITTKIIMGWSSPGEEMRYYPDLPSRFVIIPRHAREGNAGIIFVNTDPCHVSFWLNCSIHCDFKVTPKNWWICYRVKFDFRLILI